MAKKMPTSLENFHTFSYIIGQDGAVLPFVAGPGDIFIEIVHFHNDYYSWTL